MNGNTIKESEFYKQNTVKVVDVNNIERTIICTDALEYLKNLPDHSIESVFTSLPDITELPTIFCDLQLTQVLAYESWFTDVISVILRKLKYSGYAIFLQSDVRVCDKENNVVKWIDKSYLCNDGCSRVHDCYLVWHKIVLSANMNKLSAGRPSYSHLMCYTKRTEQYSYQTGIIMQSNNLESCPVIFVVVKDYFGHQISSNVVICYGQKELVLTVVSQE
jgi:hypothetical protein